MHGIRQTFAEELDYFLVNVDKPGSRDVMDQLGVRTRSSYLLLDAEGNEILRLIGPLGSRAAVEEQIAAALAELEE